MRDLTSHKVNEANSLLRIEILEENEHGHGLLYGITSDEPRNAATPPAVTLPVRFQSGPMAHGLNGITNEALLAIVRDRLECFQKGPYCCESNNDALDNVMAAQRALQRRTAERVARGVEGTHTV